MFRVMNFEFGKPVEQMAEQVEQPPFSLRDMLKMVVCDCTKHLI